MKKSRLTILTALALTLASGVGYADSNVKVELKETSEKGIYIVVIDGKESGTTTVSRVGDKTNIKNDYVAHNKGSKEVFEIQKQIKNLASSLPDSKVIGPTDEGNDAAQALSGKPELNQSDINRIINSIGVEKDYGGYYYSPKVGASFGDINLLDKDKELKKDLYKLLPDDKRSYYDKNPNEFVLDIEKYIDDIKEALVDKRIEVAKANGDEISSEYGTIKGVQLQETDEDPKNAKEQETTNATEKYTVDSEDPNTNNSTNGKSILLDNDGTFFDGPNTSSKEAPTNFDFKNPFQALIDYKVENPDIAKNASTTPKEIKNEASKKPNSEKKAINKDDCEYTTAKEGQELDQIFREKFGDPKDNPEAYELFKQLNPKYVAPGEKVYFPPTDAIAELKKTNIGNDVAKKQDTETANSIDKSKCKSVKAQSGQQMVDIFKKEFGDPKDNPDAYKLFQQLNPEFVAPDALVYFPTKEAIEAEKKKTDNNGNSTSESQDKTTDSPKTGNNNSTPSIGFFVDNLEDSCKKDSTKLNNLMRQYESDFNRAVSGTVSDGVIILRVVDENGKESPVYYYSNGKRNPEIKTDMQKQSESEKVEKRREGHVPSSGFFVNNLLDESIANNSIKKTRLIEQYEKDFNRATSGSVSDGEIRLTIVDEDGKEKKVFYNSKGERIVRP